MLQSKFGEKTIVAPPEQKCQMGRHLPCMGLSRRNFIGIVTRVAILGLWISTAVPAWTVLPQARWTSRSASHLNPYRLSWCSPRLELYQNGGDQPPKQQLSLMNSTRLYYKDGRSFSGRKESPLLDSSLPKQNQSSSTSESLSSTNENSLKSPSKGTFGDIMSPSIDDAGLLFRDGLVTSEIYSLAATYGITNPLDRMAVTANGNLQRLFSSYYDAPVLVEVEHCTRQPNAAVWNRRVLLKIFDQTFCTADSVIEVHSQDVEELVESGRVGIGQLFRHFNILPEFSLLIAGPTSNGGIWRKYTLESDLVTCSIREVFCSELWELSAQSDP
jgi:hypothetical protein